MWTFASFHAVSQSVFLVSLRKPPRKKRRQKKKINKKTFQLLGRPNSAEGSKRGREKTNSDGARR